MNTVSTNPPKAPHLKRVLGLWDVVFYGIMIVQPVAAVTLFGIASEASKGHMVTTLFIAMIAMLLTAVSYGRLASLFPSAGSAYTYVGKGLNSYLGFMAGWTMFLDYLIIPIINTMYAAFTLQRFFPAIPFFVWVVMFVVIISFINLRGIKTVAGFNKLMLAVMCTVIGIFIVLAIQYIFRKQGWSGLISFKPFYNPGTFKFTDVMTATSFAALTYIGFDGVTTLTEEVRNPEKNMLLAPILVCLFTGLFSGLQIYLAQQAWPDYSTFPHIETAFFDVANRVGGQYLFSAIGVILFIASLGSGLGGQVGAARLLYAMGRDGILPGKFFSHLSKKATPSNNIILMGLLTIIGSLILSYRNAAELINFGAFLAFMGVNIAAFRQFYLSIKNTHNRKLFRDAIFPLLGFFVCLYIWLNLPLVSKIMGGIWFAIGLIYLMIKTRNFKLKPVMIDFTDV